MITNTYFFRQRMWLWPLIALLAITPWTPAIDLDLSRAFYVDGHFESNAFFDFIYQYGFWPANVTAVFALGILIASLFVKSFAQWRAPALVLVLTLAIGAGLITHEILKDHWGRPRPKQVTEFGGDQAFRPYYKPNIFHQPEPSKSFPCGHCTTGFYFFALAFIGRRRNSKALYYTGMGLAFGLGIALSITRIAQGGHFFSDTVVGALVMWWTAYAIDRLVYGPIEYSIEDRIT